MAASISSGSRSLGPAHESLWTTKPIQINERLYVVPSHKNEYLKDFLSKLPQGWKNVRECKENSDPIHTCVLGIPFGQTPISDDLKHLIVLLRDVQNDMKVRVSFKGESAKDFPCIKPSNTHLYIYGAKVSRNMDLETQSQDCVVSLDCTDDCHNLSCILINRWVYRQLQSKKPYVSSLFSKSEEKKQSSSSFEKPSSSHAQPKPSPKKISGQKSSPVLPSYQYVPIKDVEIGLKTNIAGVVKFFKPCYQSRGTDFCTSFVLVDPSQPEDGINVTAFHKTLEGLPNIQRVGDIVILRRVKINNFNQSPQAVVFHFSSFHVFNGSLDQPLDPYKSSSNASLTEFDKNVVTKLKQWSAKHTSRKLLCKLTDVQPGDRFDMVCHLVSVLPIAAEKSMCLSVCDGTRSSLKFMAHNLRGKEDSITDQTLVNKYGNYIYDIIIINALAVRVSKLQPGQYIYLHNVRACLYYCKNANGDEVTVVQLLVNCPKGEGISCSVLPETDSDVLSLKKTLQTLVAPSSHPLTKIPFMKYVTYTRHSSHPFTKISDILASTEIPNKYRCDVQPIGISAKCIEEIVQLRCSKCRAPYAIAKTIKAVSTNTYLKAGSKCPLCEKRLPSEANVPLLKYTYVFQLYLQDDTGLISVQVTDDDANLFLANLPPTNLYLDNAARDNVNERFVVLFGRDPFLKFTPAKEPPRLDCCVYSFNWSPTPKGEKKVMYHLFDTVLFETEAATTVYHPSFIS